MAQSLHILFREISLSPLLNLMLLLFQTRRCLWAAWRGARWSCPATSPRPWRRTKCASSSGSRTTPPNQFTLMTREVQLNIKSIPNNPHAHLNNSNSLRHPDMTTDRTGEHLTFYIYHSGPMFNFSKHLWQMSQQFSGFPSSVSTVHRSFCCQRNNIAWPSPQSLPWNKWDTGTARARIDCSGRS